MQDPKEPVAFHSLTQKTSIVRTGAHHERACPWQLVGFLSHFSHGFRRKFCSECAPRGPRRGCPAQCLEMFQAPFVLQQVMLFFLQSISPNEKWCNLALNFFSSMKDVERKQSCIGIHIALHTKGIDYVILHCQKKSLSTAVIPIMMLFAMFSKAPAKRCGRSFLRKLLAEKELTTPEVRREKWDLLNFSCQVKVRTTTWFPCKTCNHFYHSYHTIDYNIQYVNIYIQ